MSNVAKMPTERPLDRPKNAIDFLPDGVQEQARFFFGFYSDTLRGTYGIATRIRFWMKSEGLTGDEAQQAMRNLMSPERSAEIETSPKVIAAMSGEVAKILRERRAREATDQRRREAEEAKSDAVSAATIRDMLAERTKLPE